MDSPTPPATAAPAAPEYISAGQAAKRLHCHIDTIRRWERAGVIRAWRTPGNQRRFKLSDIDALLQQAAA
jgi:excisionase family DNA binding protein